jgi:hypothetical protein
VAKLRLERRIAPVKMCVSFMIERFYCVKTTYQIYDAFVDKKHRNVKKQKKIMPIIVIFYPSHSIA